MSEQPLRVTISRRTSLNAINLNEELMMLAQSLVGMVSLINRTKDVPREKPLGRVLDFGELLLILSVYLCIFRLL